MSCPQQVPGLIATLTAPNGILRATLDRELRGGVVCDPGLASGVGKGIEMSRYLGRDFLEFLIYDFRFSRIGPECLGKALRNHLGVQGSKQAENT